MSVTGGNSSSLIEINYLEKDITLKTEASLFLLHDRTIYSVLEAVT